MEISSAGKNDLPAIVETIEARRRDDETHQPVFWKRTANSLRETLPLSPPC